MPCLSNPDHENAAQHLARQWNLSAERRAELGIAVNASRQEEAAALGGLDPKAKSFRSNARKFCQRTIGKRVREIQHAGAALAAISAGDLIVEADKARVKAMAEKSGAAAAISAIICKAKLAGIWKERWEGSGPDGGPIPLVISATEARL